ncbi:MAG TPA: chromosomal replication initiator protein DnaA [Terriglobia bacterium]|jgi:chromosomal replication initiator protein|nr:chromosomal replication initiator protein DnaA [Terriglobia bacterium]
MNAWQEILNFLKPKVNSQSYETWLRPTRFSRLEQGTLVVRVPNREFQEWIEEQYGGMIQEALSRLKLNAREIRYTFEESAERKPTGESDNKPVQGKLDFESVDHQLNPRYTFETFVVGNCNQFAHAAALAVAEAPSKAYNPLFLYGGVGLGKTHLMQAVGQKIKSERKDFRLAYVSSESFTNEVINSLRYDRMVSFRDKYRNVDVLLMDDIEFIAGKERTQEEFFHTFNSLYETQKQVVISSDQPPKDIPGLEERLRSRFAWGLTADLQPPDLETKMAILAKKCEAQHVTLPDPVAEFIATKIKSSIRDLEGALTRLLAYSSLTGAEISLPVAQQVLKNLVDLEERRVSIENIQRAVCREYNLSMSQLKAKDNSRAVSYPRQIAMYLAKELTTASLPQIGREFGGKHHTTVLHSITKIAEARKVDRDLNRILNKLTDSLS